MFEPEAQYTLQLAKTLWFNTYRGVVNTASGEYLATIRLIPAIPLDRAEVPQDAPHVTPHVVVIVEDASISSDQLIEFEAKTADLLLGLLRRPEFSPESCQFFYPSPTDMPARDHTSFQN